MRLSVVSLCGLLLLAQVAHSAMILESPLFKNGELIPGDFGCDIITGEDRDPYKPSPSLQWHRPPAKTQSFVLMVDDVDADGFVHWLVKDIPRDVDHLDVDASQVAMPAGSRELSNTYGAVGWGGPCPIASTHLYRFRLYALDVPSINLQLPGDASEIRSDAINAQLEAHALYVAVLSGTYTVPEAEDVGDLTSVPDDRQPTNGTGDPVPIVRYFKPSESLKKTVGKSQGVYENNKKILCRRGQLSAQLCKEVLPEEPSPEVIKAPFFPPTVNEYEPRTISTDSAAALSPTEMARRSVRPGGLEPINQQRGGMGIIVPVQNSPSVNHGAFDSAANSLVPTSAVATEPSAADCDESMPVPTVPGEMNTQILLQDDFKSTTEKEMSQEVNKLTTDLENTVGDENCNCHKGFIPGHERKYSLTLRSPVFEDGIEIPSQFVCDRDSPSASRQSIPFAWTHVPDSAQSLLLVVDVVTDYESSAFGSVLWIVANIPPTTKSLDLGASSTAGATALPEGAVELENSFGTKGYTAPCPSARGENVYRARLFALPTPSAELKLGGGYKSSQIDQQIRPLVTASMELKYTVTEWH